MKNLQQKSYLLFCILILWVIMLSGPIPVSAEEADSISIRTLWQRQQETFERSADSRECLDAHLDLLDFMYDNGIAHSSLMSAAYVQLGLQAKRNGRSSDAQWAFRAALSVNPDNAHAADAALKNSFKLGAGEVFSATLTRLVIVYNRLFNLRNLFVNAGNLALVMQIAMGLFAFISVILVMISLFPLFVHELHSKLSFIPDSKIVALLLIIIFGLILLTPASIFGLLTFWLFLGFLFGDKERRKSIWITMIFLLFVFPLTFVHVLAIQAHENRVIRMLEYCVDEGYSPEIVDELNQSLDSVVNQQERAKLHFMLGLIYKRGGFYNDAREHFIEYDKINPRDPKAMINLGNLAFIEDKVKAASEFYRKAENYDSKNPVVYYNLSKAYLSQFRFDESRNMEQKAAKLDPRLVDRFSANQSSKAARMMVDEVIPDAWINEEVTGLFHETLRNFQEYWRPVMGLSFTQSLIAWGIIFVLLWCCTWVSGIVDLSRYCLKCMKPMKPDAKSGGTDRVCVNCHMVYFRKGLGAKETEDSNTPFNLKKVFVRFLATVIPGSNQLFLGRVYTAVFFLIPFGMIVGYFVSQKHFIPGSVNVPSISSVLTLILAILTLVILYSLSIYLGYREED